MINVLFEKVESKRCVFYDCGGYLHSRRQEIIRCEGRHD